MTISVIDSASSMRRVLAATPDDRADLVREMWSPLAGMYHFIPGGVDMATVHRQNFGFDWEGATEPIQGALERLVEADAWNRITASIPDWSLELYGEGPLRSRLQRMIDENEIPRVTLMGKTDRVGDVVASSKVHVLSSVHEGLPIAIVEAGLLGAPTVAFDCAPGIRELIESGRNGVVVPPRDSEQLARQLLRLAEDEQLLINMSDNCVEDMKQYSPSAIIDRWEELFAEMSR